MRRNNSKLGWLIAIVAIAAVVASAVAGAMVYFEKKRRDDQELEHYLDCSIQ